MSSKPLKNESILNDIEKFSSLLTENVTLVFNDVNSANYLQQICFFFLGLRAKWKSLYQMPNSAPLIQVRVLLKQRMKERKIQRKIQCRRLCTVCHR